MKSPRRALQRKQETNLLTRIKEERKNEASVETKNEKLVMEKREGKMKREERIKI